MVDVLDAPVLRQRRQHVAVDHDERVVDPGVVGGEADGAGRVEWFGLDRIVQRDTGTRAIGKGL